MRHRLLLPIAAVFVALGLLTFHRYGRSLWHPVKVQVFGERTVADVLAHLDPEMRRTLPDLPLLTDGRPLALLGLKSERRLEVWKETRDGWRWVRDYPFTGYSGRLGPKLREGDRQIPEGCYRICFLNPNSSYHLSMQIDYPNSFDRAKASRDGRTNLGGEIFLHGLDLTIGCIPVGNRAIEELFYLVARNGRKKTSVILAPYDMRSGKRDLEIEGIDWEDELYALIAERLRPFKRGR